MDLSKFIPEFVDRLNSLFVVIIIGFMIYIFAKFSRKVTKSLENIQSQIKENKRTIEVLQADTRVLNQKIITKDNKEAFRDIQRVELEIINLKENISQIDLASLKQQK
jgi:hypothetical protein